MFFVKEYHEKGLESITRLRINLMCSRNTKSAAGRWACGESILRFLSTANPPFREVKKLPSLPKGQREEKIRSSGYLSFHPSDESIEICVKNALHYPKDNRCVVEYPARDYLQVLKATMAIICSRRRAVRRRIYYRVNGFVLKPRFPLTLLPHRSRIAPPA